MHSASYFISPHDPWSTIGTAPSVLPAAIWRDPGRDDWTGSLDPARAVVVACKAAHEMSQLVAADLRAKGFDAGVLAGDDDHGLLRQGFVVYDGLFAYLRFAAQERHNWPAKAA